MSDIDELPNSGLFIRRRHLPVAAAVLAAVVMCVGVTGIYAGSTMQASKNDDEVARLTKAKSDQKLDYEQRLGKQSAQYALDANNFGLAIASFRAALDRMDAKNDRRAAERERAQVAAIEAAQRAAAAAAATAKTTDQILAKQSVVQQQVTEAASAAKATEQKLDSAVHPTAAVPAHIWSSGGGR